MLMLFFSGDIYTDSVVEVRVKHGQGLIMRLMYAQIESEKQKKAEAHQTVKTWLGSVFFYFFVPYDVKREDIAKTASLCAQLHFIYFVLARIWPKERKKGSFNILFQMDDYLRNGTKSKNKKVYFEM